MKNKKRILIASSLAALLIGASAVAVAKSPGFGHGKHGPMGGGPGMRLLHLAETLDLTEQQEVMAVRVRRTLREEMKANKDQMKGTFDEVLLELERPEPDTAKLHRLVDDISTRMTKVAHLSVDEYMKLHRTLSEEQRQQLVDRARLMKEERAGRRFERKQRRGLQPKE
jgi:Spy/CpxP family protein refolding chaperone